MLYEIPLLNHVAPETIEDAVFWLNKYGEKSKIIAGGTELLGLIKDEISAPKMPMPEVLVSVKKIPQMNTISYSGEEGLSIGASITLTELEDSRIVQESFPAISQAAKVVATRQIRNVGTVGGNLCQRPWCWYFRSPLFPCFKKGGQQCYAITGEHQYYFSAMGLGTCVMSHPSDLAPAFVSLEACVTIAGPEGLRSVPIENFFNGPKEVFDNILKPNEVLVNVTVPKKFAKAASSYVKYRIRETWDFAIASAAVAMKMSGGKCIESRVTLGGLAPFPYRSREAELVLNNSIPNEEVAERAAVEAMKKARGLPMTKYKVQIGRAILKRAILSALDGHRA